ncbi:hypothetical protein [Noviherbaspirillum aerium]|uniref:hypothetical protein n=1 Tax=Noviherbaspirillum aerium TaxID=2588497 RepID=UPI00124CF18C|nr:hypothetical protein [Noviherbaspirillum aerium]
MALTPLNSTSNARSHQVQDDEPKKTKKGSDNEANNDPDKKAKKDPDNGSIKDPDTKAKKDPDDEPIKDPDSKGTKDPDNNNNARKYRLTDYDAAREVDSFMKKNREDLQNGRLSYQNIWEGADSGTVGGNGKVIDLTEKQHAAFKKFADNDFALYGRLKNKDPDDPEGALDPERFRKNMRDSSKLHGSNESDEGHWKDPIGSTTGPDSQKALSKYFNEQFGEDWKDVSLKTVEQMANNGRYYDQEKKNWVEVDDPEVTRAAAWLHRNSGEVETEGMNGLGRISRSEFDNWNKV